MASAHPEFEQIMNKMLQFIKTIDKQVKNRYHIIYISKNDANRISNDRKDLHNMFEDFKALLVEQMNIDEADITPEAELVADLGINSLELADLVFSCEAKYNLEIDEDDYKKFITVGDVVEYLEAHQA